MIAATVLAAGDSIRMGSPKALLDYRGATFLGSILRTAREGGIRDGVVVTGARLRNRLSEIDLHGFSAIETEEPKAGPIGSIRTALRQFDASVAGALIWPVDLPHVRSSTVVALMRAVSSAKPIIAPAYGSRRGHPILIKSEVFQEVLQLPSGQTLRDIVRADPGRVYEVTLEDSAVVDAINTPEDYARLIEAVD